MVDDELPTFVMPTWATLSVIMEAILFTTHAWPVWMIIVITVGAVALLSHVQWWNLIIGFAIAMWAWIDSANHYSQKLARRDELKNTLSHYYETRWFAKKMRQRFARRQHHE